jgi:hypothetical protein
VGRRPPVGPAVEQHALRAHVAVQRADRAGVQEAPSVDPAIDLTIGRLIVVDYTSAAGGTDDSLQFVFDCGCLDAARIGAIRLPPAELSAFRFAARDEALALLGGRLARRMPA